MCFCIETQEDPDFVVAARVEAFIAGWDLDEALRRAEAYRNAGADAILMHSKKSDPSDIEAFMNAWKNQVRCSVTSFAIIHLLKFIGRLTKSFIHYGNKNPLILGSIDQN